MQPRDIYILAHFHKMAAVMSPAVAAQCCNVFSPSPVFVMLVQGPLEQFDAWLSTFSMEEKRGEVSDLLVSSPSIRALYTKMVQFVFLIRTS